MEFAEWEPVYETILAEFGFDREADERARDLLASLTDPFDDGRLTALAGQTVAIAGAGPSLETPSALENAAEADAVVAASTAADVCLANDVDVDCLVTDLDGTPETAIELTRRDVPVAIHAHGDNVPRLREVLPACADECVLPTTQARPRGGVRNVGGFTDGDRAAFLADAFDADALVFVGWDLDDPAVGPVKAKKLAWAERLLYWLERRRNERFDLLDGRRADVETDGLPIDGA